METVKLKLVLWCASNRSRTCPVRHDISVRARGAPGSVGEHFPLGPGLSQNGIDIVAAEEPVSNQLLRRLSHPIEVIRTSLIALGN